ncbi:hypothetical protein CTAYLR_007012, partial [Chrysophaeum taylorii]
EIRFDAIMGALEDILMSDDFASAQQAFCKEHGGVFGDTEENKHEYHDVFQKYSQLMETHIENRLANQIPARGPTSLITRGADETTGDVFDLLLGLCDFAEFKQMMLAFKRGESLGFEVVKEPAAAAAAAAAAHK